MAGAGDFLDRIRKFGRTIKVDSFAIAGFHLRFDTDSLGSGSFSHLSSFVDNPKSNDVFVLSAHNVDEVTAVDRIDADHECEALRPPARSAGGSGANTAFTLGHLGAKVMIAGIVGQDDDGDYLKRSLADAGISLELILTSSASPTGKTITLVGEGGQRFIVVFPNVNSSLAEKASLPALTRAALNSKIVHLSSFVGSQELQLQEALVKSIAGKSLVSLTPGALYARQGLDRLEQLLRYVHIVFLYREQLEQLIQNSSAKSLLKGNDTHLLMDAYFAWKGMHGLPEPQVLVVKDHIGSSGIIDHNFLRTGIGASALERYFLPRELPSGVRVQAIDTTGVGDAAAAGFLYGMLRKGSLESCVDSAFMMAAFTSTNIGGRAALVNDAENPYLQSLDHLPIRIERSTDKSRSD
jgi:ribokinase